MLEALCFFPVLFRFFYVHRMSTVVQAFSLDSDEQLAKASAFLERAATHAERPDVQARVRVLADGLVGALPRRRRRHRRRCLDHSEGGQQQREEVRTISWARYLAFLS